MRSSGDPEDWTGQYVNGPGLARVLRLPVVAGSLADLTGTGTVAVPAGSWRLGQTATMWLADSTPVRLRVVAVLADQIDLEQTVLLPSALRAGHTSVPMASTVYLSLSPGARLAAIRAAAAAGGGAVGPTSGYLTAANAENDRINRLAMVAILGMALAYTAIAIANTLVMATGDRIRELATLRLSGATPGQVLRLIGVEACLVSGIGTLLAAAVTAATVIGLRHGLLGLAPSVRVVIPWLPLAGIALACLAIAVAREPDPRRARVAAAAGRAGGGAGIAAPGTGPPPSAIRGRPAVPVGTVLINHRSQEAGVATKITVVLEDDLDGGPADETVRFGLDGVEYEIDLSKQHARTFRRELRVLPRPRPPGGTGTAAPAGTQPIGPSAQRRHPGVGEGRGHPGQRPGAHPGQRRGAVSGRHRRALRPAAPGVLPAARHERAGPSAARTLQFLPSAMQQGANGAPEGGRHDNNSGRHRSG